MDVIAGVNNTKTVSSFLRIGGCLASFFFGGNILCGGIKQDSEIDFGGFSKHWSKFKVDLPRIVERSSCFHIDSTIRRNSN